jgi:hypothetical protein
MKKDCINTLFLGLTVISKAQTTELFWTSYRVLKKNVSADGKLIILKSKSWRINLHLDNIAKLDTCLA